MLLQMKTLVTSLDRGTRLNFVLVHLRCVQIALALYCRLVGVICWTIRLSVCNYIRLTFDNEVLMRQLTPGNYLPILSFRNYYRVQDRRSTSSWCFI